MFHSAKFYRRTCLGCFATVALTKFRCGAKHWRLVKDSAGNDGITGGAANIDNTETNSSSNTPINESHSNTDDESVLKGGVEKDEHTDQPDDIQGAKVPAESNSPENEGNNNGDENFWDKYIHPLVVKLQGEGGKHSPASLPGYNYFGIGEKLAEGKSANLKKHDKYNTYQKFSDLPNNSLKKQIKYIILRSDHSKLEKDLKNVDIVTAKENAPITKEVLYSKQINDIIKNNWKSLSQGEYIIKPIHFEKINNDNSQTINETMRYFAIHNATLNMHLNNNHIQGEIIDWNDYAHTSKNKNNDDSIIGKLKDFTNNQKIKLINRAYEIQESDKSKKFILRIPIDINLNNGSSEDFIDEIKKYIERGFYNL